MFVDLPVSREENRRIAVRLFELIEERGCDMAESIVEVDPSIYWDPEVAERERRRIFDHVPIIAAHASEVPEPHDFVTVQLPSDEAIVVRQGDGSVRAFVNVCRHRGARLVMEEEGHRRLFTCGYHGWTYEVDGALRNVAGSQTFGDLDPACHGLIELPCEVRHGCVWVVDRPGATIDVAEWLGEMDELLATYELDRYTCYRMGAFDEPINWKALVDAFVDGYHLAATHSQTVAPHFYSNIQIYRQMGRHSHVVTPRKSIDRIRRADAGDHQVDPHVTMGHYLLPNSSFLRQPDHFELLTWMPHPTDPERSTMRMRILTRHPAETPDERERWDKNWEILMAVLKDEDLVMNRGLQRAVRNHNAPTLVLGRNEMGNQRFHLWLREMLGDPGGPAADGSVAP